MQLIVGRAGFDDLELDDGAVPAAEVRFVHAPVGTDTGHVDRGGDMRPPAGIASVRGGLFPMGAVAAGSQTSASLTSAGVPTPSRREPAGLRRDLDDAAATTVWSASLNRFAPMPEFKWTLQ